jgi:hypothetical protein
MNLKILYKIDGIIYRFRRWKNRIFKGQIFSVCITTVLFIVSNLLEPAKLGTWVEVEDKTYFFSFPTDVTTVSFMIENSEIEANYNYFDSLKVL